MSVIFRQAERIGRLNTALGADALVLLRFGGSDHLNELFEWRVEALSTHPDVDFDALVGTHATVTIEGRHGPRHFDGIVTQARWAGAGENGYRYDLVLRPWFWLAGRRRNQRIFHNQTVIAILQELLSEYASLGEPALEVAVINSYPVLEYTVQYRESDLDFARRQMERHGISFYFRHTQGSHTLVLSDDVSTHPDVGAREYKSHDGHHQAKTEHFWEWARERNLTTGATRLMDYNFKTPMAAMEAERQGDAAYAQGLIESYDYPGDYIDRERGRDLAGQQLRSERGGDRRHRASGDCISLGAGMQVTLSGDPVPGTGDSYVVLSGRYKFVSQAFGSGQPEGEGDEYAFSAGWTMMPVTAPMVPPKRANIPVVQGPQTAMVVGAGEIDCDEYGRILVRFHWDLPQAHSMRCRVSQNWAGAGWGGMVIPRIGMEVVVEFLEGDPDKPIVTGNVFNGMNDSPYPLPANKSKMVIRSQTHQGSGFNELSFEDQAGRQEIFLHGQKDHRIQILNDQNQSIGNDRSKSVGRDQSESVGNDKSISVGNNHNEQIAADKSLHVGGSHQETVEGDMSVSVTGNMAETVSAARTVIVADDHSTTVQKGDHSLLVETGDQSTTVNTGARHVQVLAAGQYTTVKQDIVTVSEAGGISITASTNVVISAPDIILQADASNFIQISKGQIIIEGAETHINPRVKAPDS